MLRNAMDLAQTDKQRKQILKEVAGTGAFQGLVFAAEWLDNAAVKVEAAKAVLKIALANKDYAGTGTRQAITKAGLILGKSKQVNQYLNSISGNGLVKVFNGKNLDGWKGLVENPIARAKMTPVEEAQKQIGADEIMRRDWNVIDGQIVYGDTALKTSAPLRNTATSRCMWTGNSTPRAQNPTQASIFAALRRCRFGTRRVLTWAHR